MKSKALLRAGVVVAAATLLLSGCSGSSDNNSSGESGGNTRAVMYSANNENTNTIVIDAAADLDPSLKVDMVTGGSIPLLERIKSEERAKSADVYYSNTPHGLEGFKDLFAPYDSPEAAALPKEMIQPDHLWTVTNQHVVAVMVNKDQVGAAGVPKSWKDLTNPAFKGKITSPDPTSSTTGYTALYGAYKVLGEEDFKKLAQNIVVQSSSGNTYPAVAQGEYAVGLGYESNIYPFIAGGQAGVEMFYPADGTFTVTEATALIKDSPNPEAGKRLLDLIASKDTQIALLEGSFRRPARTDIDPSQYVKFLPLDQLKIVDTSDGTDHANEEKFLKVWEASKA